MVLTATRGEGGEVIPAELRHLEGDRVGLARVREQEIAEALRALGASTHAFVTYAASGGHAQADHVRVHEATLAAIELAEWRTGRLVCVDTPTELAQRAFDPGQAGFAETGFAPVEAIPSKPPVDRIVISQDVTAVLAAKRAALEAHRTQVSVSGAFFALSNGVGQRIGD